MGEGEELQNNRNKLAYRYMFTPQGMQEKAALTASFFKRKVAEYERLQEEIAVLRKEVVRDAD